MTRSRGYERRNADDTVAPVRRLRCGDRPALRGVDEPPAAGRRRVRGLAALAGLARSGPEALRPEFALLVREMRLLGFEPAMVALRERLADPVMDMVVAALVLNERVGSRNVSQVLDRLAHATRAQLQVRGE